MVGWAIVAMVAPSGSRVGDNVIGDPSGRLQMKFGEPPKDSGGW
jgi:hypothetical protein